MGVSESLKEKLIKQVMERRLGQRKQGADAPMNTMGEGGGRKSRFGQHPAYRQLRIVNDGAELFGISNPFFKVHDGVAGSTTQMGGTTYINFSNYNYLGLSGHPEVADAAKAAIDRYGMSVSASRVVSGERQIHRDLEQALAEAYGTDDAVVFVSGHATNVSVIGHLFGPNDLIVHDELAHNSIVQGAQLSGAKRLTFPHNDWQALDSLLAVQRNKFDMVLIALEGIYSMDGDFPDLPRFVELRKRHDVFLMVDEAHSFGVMGVRGLGIREHFGLDSCDVDIWMGTLSKTLAGCGGYIAGEATLVEQLKFLSPGFLYSVGMSPPLAAASLAALRIMLREPERVATLQERGKLFLELAREAGVATGASNGLAIIPAITGSSVVAARLSAALLEQGINVQPILYPAVPEKLARLRFFLSCEHTVGQIRQAVSAISGVLATGS